MLTNQWQKATKSGAAGHCVEVRLTGEWKASTASGGGNCVEVRRYEGNVEVRNSRFPDGTVLSFTPEEWDAFCDGARHGEFEIKE